MFFFFSVCECVFVCAHSLRARECGCTCFTVVQGPAPRQQRPQRSLTVVSPPPSSSSSSELDLTDGGNSTRAQRGPRLLTHSPLPPLPQACSCLPTCFGGTSSSSRTLPPQASVTNSVACMRSHFHAMLWIYTHANGRKRQKRLRFVFAAAAGRVGVPCVYC